MKRTLLRLSLLLPLIPAFALESHPAGVVMYFMNANGPDFQSFCSYTDLTPFGYGQWGPILTVICTCALAALSVIFIIRAQQSVLKAIFWLSIAAAVASLSQGMLGLRWLTWVNVVVAALMLLEAGLAFFLRKCTPEKIS
jgi:uncharacterized membrane protein YfhO